MVEISQITQYIPGVPGSGFSTIFVNVMIILMALVFLLFVVKRLMKYKFAVELWKFDEHGNFQITTDTGGIEKKDGVRKLRLLKNKVRQVDNFIRYPIKKGLLKKQKDKIYLTEENGALRGLVLQKVSNFFSADGKFLNADSVYFADGKELIPLAQAELFTKDRGHVYAHPTHMLSPSNNDSQNAASLEMRNVFTQYHVPQWWEKIQIAGVIVAGIIAGVIVFIVNKAG